MNMNDAERRVLAAALYVLWLLVAFVLRTIVHLRRTGSSGYNGLSGAPGSAEWFAGVLFVLSLVAGFVSALLHGVVPTVSAVETSWLLAAGVVTFLVGALATTASQAAMGASWRIGVDDTEDTALVTGGAFAYARNPIFTTMAVTALGLFLIVPNVVSLVAVVALWVALELQVRKVEEPHLLHHHGEAYAKYARRVGRFVPGVGLLR